MAYSVMRLEDDPFIALDMEGVMEDAGFDVVGPVASVPEAMKLLASCNGHAPDCALLDFYVTGGTSEFVARELAKKNIPFLFVTGNSEDVKQTFADETPIIRSKPVEIDRILNDVKSLLS